MLTLLDRPKILWFLLAIVFSAIIGMHGFVARAEAAEAAPHIASWNVLEVAGSARYRVPAGISWSQAEVGHVLPPGSRIITHEAGTLTIERFGETITMKPSARLMLPPDYRTHRAQQEVGSLSYHVERTPGRRFEVETPYAALVVKGTAFDVDVTAGGVAVSVEHGRVEVTSRGGATAELAPGDAAKVGAAADAALEVRRGRGGVYEPVEPANLTWFDRFLDVLGSIEAGGAGPGDAGIGGGAHVGGSGLGGVSVGGSGVNVGGSSIGGGSLGGVSVGGGGVSVGGSSVGGASVGGASVGGGGASVGGSSVGGVSVGGVSVGGGGVSVGGLGIGGR